MLFLCTGCIPISKGLQVGTLLLWKVISVLKCHMNGEKYTLNLYILYAGVVHIIHNVHVQSEDNVPLQLNTN